MNTYLIWLTAVALEAVVIFRGMRSGLLRRFPFFYTYVACVFASEFLRFACYRIAPSFYQAFYWDSELIIVVVSYAILVDIFAQSLEYSPGVLRLAQKLLLVVFVLAASYAVHGGVYYWSRVTADMGRYLRYIEGAVLLVMLWLFVRNRISLGRNLLGLTIGYSLLVGLDVNNLALLFQRGRGFSIGLRNLHTIMFPIALVIWCASLWSPCPEPVRPAESPIERDYRLLRAKSWEALAHLSGRITRTLRP